MMRNGSILSLFNESFPNEDAMSASRSLREGSTYVQTLVSRQYARWKCSMWHIIRVLLAKISLSCFFLLGTNFRVYFSS